MRELFAFGRIALLAIALAGSADTVLARTDDVRLGSPPGPPGITANTPPRAAIAGPGRVELNQLATYDATRTSDLEDANRALIFR